MNENIYKDKIVFKTESIGEEITVLDIKVNVVKDHKVDDEDRFLLVPSMYSKKTDTHQYLSPKSFHPKHKAENIPLMVANRCRANCSDSVKDDQLFKDALIQYKAFLLKSGDLIDKKFINYAIKNKRKSILKRNHERKERKKEIRKYRFVTDFEPSFPSIKTAFKKFKNIIEEDEELQQIFPKGIKHFQVLQQRGSKNIKEMLAPSTANIRSVIPANIENQPNIGSHPCEKPCVYCTLLRKSEAETFQSLKLQLHDGIYRLRFCSNSLTHILSLSNSTNNVASLQKNRADKSHCVIVA